MPEYKMYLVLGDWSSDGHGISHKVLLNSNVPVAEVQQAYKDACRLTTVSFNHNENYTGVERDYKEEDDWQIASEYGEPSIPAAAFENLKAFGLLETFKIDGEPVFDKAYLKTYQGDEYEPVMLEDDGVFVALWIWFVRLANPEIKLVNATAKDETPCINGYWNKDLNVQFGYGLYSN